MPKALITGHRGFIGSHLYAELQKRGWEVHGIDLKDGQDIRTMEFSGNYDVIFHCAAKASIPASFTNPLTSHGHNVLGSLRVLEFAKRIGARVIFSSSSSIYGEPLQTPTSEKCPPNYSSPYALMKRNVEEYMRLLGVNGACLRYFNVYGERQEIANEGDNSLVLAIFLEQRKYQRPLTIVGNGEQRRDFVYVGDVVEANIMAAQQKWQGIFNVGTGVNYSINEVARMIGGIGIERLEPRIEPQIGLADITKIKSMGWSPKMELPVWLKSQF